MTDSREPNHDSRQDSRHGCASCGRGGRRDFMLKAGVGLMGAGGVAVGAPIIGFLLGPVEGAHGLAWIDLGPVDAYPVGQTRFGEYEDPFNAPINGLTRKTGCWIRRVTSGQFQVFSVNCAHLGCPVRWFEQSKLFLCPCHGGAYYEDGSRASGPPPRGLFEYPWRIEGGRLHIQAGRLPGIEDPTP